MLLVRGKRFGFVVTFLDPTGLKVVTKSQHQADADADADDVFDDDDADDVAAERNNSITSCTN